MVIAIKIILMIMIFLVLSYPLFPLPSKFRRFSTFYALKYRPPFQKRNLIFLPIVIGEFVAVAFLIGTLTTVSAWVQSIPIIGDLTSHVSNGMSSQINFVLFVFQVLLGNGIVLYAFVLVKGLLKRALIDPLMGWNGTHKMTRAELKERSRQKRIEKKAEKLEKKNRKQAKKKGIKEMDLSEETDTDDQSDEKTPYVRKFPHSKETDADQEKDKGAKKKAEKDGEDIPKEELPPIPQSRILQKFYGLFFEAPEYRYARPSVARATAILQIFVYIAELFYLILFMVLAAMVFFPLPPVIYEFLINTLHIRYFYVYPFISLIFLQELCNFLRTEKPLPDTPEQRHKKQEEESKFDVRLNALNAELKKRFDANHYFRYYPEVPKQEVPEYVISNRPYAGALEYVRTYMQKTAHHVVQSYMESLDAAYNENHVYFGIPFYSEFGEYLIAYVYTRLLSGERMMFIVPDEKSVEPLRKYVRDRLITMTGSSEKCTWRVCSSGERLDQADILIATPENFKDDGMINHFPTFFEEVCNAVFIDAGEIITMNGFLCPIMAIRLQKATENRIRFIFLSNDVLRGFASKNLPRYFCIDKIFSGSSALENEYTSYTLLNRESKDHRIYNKHGQQATGLECIIAEQAHLYGIDGVRVVTNAPINHADRVTLAAHHVEINEFYKSIPVIHYMIYSDDRCNLAAAIYACTRFRGQRKSVANIISKPYLLREYFMHMAGNGEYINRSSFIQPRVTEYIDDQKLSLLRIFCEASMETGISVELFTEKMLNVIRTAQMRFADPICPFCKMLLEQIGIEKFTVADLAAYLIAGIFDTRKIGAGDSMGHRAKDYYLVVDSKQSNGLFPENKQIVFKRTRDVFECLLAQNQRVRLLLNDKCIGQLNLFPNRVPQQYMVGQNLTFDNVEYEIECISDDCSIIYLRCENITFKNSLDTFFLRRYHVGTLAMMGEESVLHNSVSVLADIRVCRMNAPVVGENYGFYTLSTDQQTLDFVRGVEGNPFIGENAIRKNARHLENAKILSVSLVSKNDCSDGMRLLLAAVFNEFIKTIFPGAYRLIAICPILMEPIKDGLSLTGTKQEQVQSLYPYLKDSCHVEEDPKRMQFLFINDCEEDVGVLDWFYDGRAQYMQEFLSHVYSYLRWLSVCGKAGSYIYFGQDQLPECFDLSGCCSLLKDLNIRLSDDGKEDFDTAGDFNVIHRYDRCSFCHKLVESGRYARFDQKRFICADCFDVINDEKKLNKLLTKVYEYLKTTYPENVFGSVNVAFDPVYELDEDQVFSENYYRVDYESRTIYVERDQPVMNAEVSLLRGIIGLWLFDNSLLIPCSTGMLYFEELKYLRLKKQTESADWILKELDCSIRNVVDEITEYVYGRADLDGSDNGDNEGSTTETEDNGDNEGSTTETEDNGDNEGSTTETEDKTSENSTNRTSFMYIREIAAQLLEDDFDDGQGMGDYSNDLYDPNKTPRFWKYYLMNSSATEQGDLSTMDEEDLMDTDNDIMPNVSLILPNAPLPPDGDDDFSNVEDDDSTGDDDYTEDDPPVDNDSTKESKTERRKRITEEKKRAKEQKKKEKEEKRNARKKKGEIDVTDLSDEDEKVKDDKIEEKKQEKKKKGTDKAKAKRRKELEEEEENKNPKVRLYNEIYRRAIKYDQSEFSREYVPDSKEVERIFMYVCGDYPELFWVAGYSLSAQTMSLKYRCKTDDDKVDKHQINQKRKAIVRGAKTFTKGITRKTKPYDAFLTIYRRLILTLDYDSVGLNNNIGRDLRYDDNLRSLYSALVEHKVVCAGYAVALQYLLQSVGISCGYVISETGKDGTTHAFNVMRIGKYCYYTDVTWGDSSNTLTGNQYKNLIKYDYCCVPLTEFLQTSENLVACHMPRKAFYPDLEEFKSIKHEYFRYHHAYLDRYDETELIRIFADAALNYRPDEMGDFVVSFRCVNIATRDYIVQKLTRGQKMWEILEKARRKVATAKKKRQEYLEWKSYIPLSSTAPTLYLIPKLKTIAPRNGKKTSGR